MKRFDDKNGTDDKKKRKRILFMAGLIAGIIITAALFYFNSFVMKTENSRARDSLLEWTEQNAALVGSRIDMYYDLLECAADYISDMPLDKAQTEEMLREKFHRHTEKFDSLKIISEDGRCVQDGQTYSLKEYFLMAMLGNRGLAENGYSYADGVILSVPVKNEAQQIKGVLCGTLPCSSLDVYGKADRRKGYAGLFVIDNHGKYIVSDGGNDTFDNDFLTWLEGRELSLPISDIKSQMDSGFRYYFAISDEDGDYMVTAAPVDGKKLFAVTMADNRYIHQAGLRYRIWVFVITLVIILSLIAVIGVYLYFRREDRIAIRNLNRQLMLNEETYRITARESDLCVFTYDVETEQIQFLNDKYQNLGLDQSELRDAVHQHTAGHMQGLVNGDLVAKLCQIACGGQAGRACADDGDLVAVGRRHDGGGVDIFTMPVGHEALQTANADGLVLDAAGTLALALALLRTDTAADGGQGRGTIDDLIGGFEVTLGHMADELGDVDADGAAGLAGLVLAVDAALGLVDGHFFGVAQSNFLEVLVADVGVLGGHGALFGIHIESHLTFPPES